MSHAFHIETMKMDKLVNTDVINSVRLMSLMGIVKVNF